jgi:hypothetical protein
MYAFTILNIRSTIKKPLIRLDKYQISKGLGIVPPPISKADISLGGIVYIGGFYD